MPRGGFMGKAWDGVLPDPEVWAEALRVARPGAHLVAFGAPRLYHRLACQIEDAGWVLRDSLMWIFGSGFPKSLDVSKAIDKAAGAEREVVGLGSFAARRPRATAETNTPGAEYGFAPGHTLTAPATPEAARWSGWGTALKPAYEPIVLARKPLEGTVAGNVLEHGTGAINVDGCRIGTADDLNGGAYSPDGGRDGVGYVLRGGQGAYTQPAGRWPANLLLGCACDGEHDPGCAVAMLDEQSGETRGHTFENKACAGERQGPGWGTRNPVGARGFADTGGASRFFYTAKAARAEREAGLSGPGTPPHEITGRKAGSAGQMTPYAGVTGGRPRLNTHPTVKPLDLMRWLVRLVTPPGGLVLDPFAGSGTTGIAAALEGFGFVGCELDPGHAEIARTRIEHWRSEAEAQPALLTVEPEPSPLRPWVQRDLFE